MVYLKIIAYFLICNLISNTWSKPHFKTDRYCGERLGSVVSLVCKGVYNSPVKKAALEDIYNDYEMEDNKLVAYPYYLPKALARALIPARMQRGGGIVDECCKKPCGWQELQAYCG